MRKYGLFVDASGTLFNEARSLEKALYDDARIFIKEIQSRKLDNNELITGIITNCGNEIHDILRELKINDHFDHIICSDDVLSLKPSRKIFQYALSEAKLNPEQIFYIGDSLQNDAQGAQNSGMTGIWLNRYSSTLSDFTPQCSSLTEALEIIKRIVIVKNSKPK
jgi:HAD superfamily hydrolase (TIGR01549 family)